MATDIRVERKLWEQEDTGPRVGWGAVVAGLFIAIAAQVVLSLFGLAVGLTAVDPRQGVPGAEFGVGAGVWAVVSLLLSLFLGAWVAGRLSGTRRAGDGALGGVLVWALSLLVMLYMVGTGVGALVSGAFGVVGTVAQTTATVAGQQAAAGRDAAAQAEEAARRAGIDVDRARQQAEQAAQQAQETLQRLGQSGAAENVQARQAAARATTYAAAGAWALLIGTLLGLAVAAIGGALGVRRAPTRAA
ncbi:MAG TPA: hypothetical protein VNM66_09465 [Thermodesulfobacteriota bacterium]|nr:hypothetical protein [Thermodesulfobacteriota bacterium]